MKSLIGYLTLLMVLMLAFVSCSSDKDDITEDAYRFYYPDSKPLIRWWWHASVYNKSDISAQLDRIKANNFGGVEIAWIYPVNRDSNHVKIEWLGEEWQDIVEYTKQYCDEIGIHCDFTFGSLWPFGATFVPDSMRTKVMNDASFRQELRLSWEHPKIGNVIDHMDSAAFGYYSSVMGEALSPALSGSKSALFCDSWEVQTRLISTDGFTDRFIKTYGYDINEISDSLYNDNFKHMHYDYMKLVSEYVINNFYRNFWQYAENNNAFARVQCAGSPTDLITAYSYADVPESEAMLYEPNFSNIVASSAVLSGRREVSAETFTCLYGFPDIHFGKEQTADLKLVADALFANGVNQIVWHGMPYNPVGSDSIKFYATVHTAPDSHFAHELKEFNTYLQEVSAILKSGKPYTSVAVYLPLEDAWIAQELPEEKQMKWSWGEYELRYIDFPDYTKGYHPYWINEHFLSKGRIIDGKLVQGDAVFDVLVIDAQYLDLETLRTIKEKAEDGLKIYFSKRPKQAGKFKSIQYMELLGEIFAKDNVYEHFSNAIGNKPIISGDDMPDYLIRVINNDYYIFFSHPFAKDLSLPLEYGFSYSDEIVSKEVLLHTKGVTQNILLEFEPYSSIIMKVDNNNNYSFLNISFKPRTPERIMEN